MKSSTYLIGLLTFSLFSITACKKDTVEEPNPSNPNPNTTNFASLSEYLNTKEVTANTFTIDAATGGQFTTDKGSVVTIPANAFITYDNNLITGNVEVNMKEVFSNSDQIFSRIFPTSNSNVLNSGGEFFINVTQNGETLTLNNVDIQVDIPAQAPEAGMNLFFAEGDIDADSVNWELFEFNPQDSNFNSSFSFNSADDSYEITLDSLGWCNIDGFLPSVNYFDCVFDLVGVNGLNSSNTNAYAVFEGENAVWPMGQPSWGDISANQITDSHLADVPMNVIVISVVDGQLYYGLLNVTPVDGVTYQINMQATTSANLDTVINGLP